MIYRLGKLIGFAVGIAAPYLLGVLVAHLCDVKPDGSEWGVGVLGYFAVLGALGLVGGIAAAYQYVRYGDDR